MVRSQMGAIVGSAWPERGAGSRSPGDEDGRSGTAIITKTKPRTKRPNLYRVLLLNDDGTCRSGDYRDDVVRTPDGWRSRRRTFTARVRPGRLDAGADRLGVPRAGRHDGQAGAQALVSGCGAARRGRLSSSARG